VQSWQADLGKAGAGGCGEAVREEVEMPWLPLYLFDADFGTLLALLNEDPEIAFVISDGVGRWKAIATLDAFNDKRLAIWHVPSGPLPLLAAVTGDPHDEINDPWGGWTERRASVEASTPYFGPGHPGIFWLNLKNYQQGNEDAIGISSFEWIGHRYSIIGNVPAPDTDKWWKRFASKIRRLSIKMPRGGPNGPFKPEIYALPSAARAIANGKEAANNP
jgi:hypothetical protein